MLAVKIPGKETVKVVEVPKPIPGKGQVLVKMKASALCRSDLHRYHGEAIFDEKDGASITPGHEPCGIVEAKGEGVKNICIGDRVAIFLGLGCGICPYCLAGDVVLCSHFKCIGFQVDGAHADYIVVPEENCLLLPVGMSYITGALATDVGGTLYTACKRLGVDGTKIVSIYGVGPMGCGGVLMAKAFGATVAAIDLSEERLKLAEELGADYTINPKHADVRDEIYKIAQQGADVSIVCASSSQAITDALDTARPGGVVGLIAESADATIHPSNQFLRKKIALVGCWYFKRNDWEEIAGFILRKKIPLEKISTKSYGLSDSQEAFRLFDLGVTQKVLFVWD